MSGGSESFKATISEIDSLLKTEGVKVHSDQERLSQLWLLFKQAKNNLKLAVENIDVLRSQFANETKEFEGYVEHITKLSDEREAVAIEYESQNRQFKEQIQQLKQQIASYENTEARDMLGQAGLDDIVHIPTSAQIAYLLVERARLMDRLEELQNECLLDMPDGSIFPRSVTNRQKKIPTDGKGRGRPLVEGEEIPETSWCKLKELLDKVDDLETSNDHLMERLKTLAPDEYQQLLLSLPSAIANSSNGAGSLSRPKMSDFVSKKPFVPPKDLEEAIARLEIAEEKAAEAEFLQLALKEKSTDRIIDDEESFASLLGSPRGGPGTRELDRQNREIQNAMSAVGTHLQQLIQTSGGLSESDVSGEMASMALAGKLTVVQQEFERIKEELVKMMEKYKIQYRKYADHKLAVKNKLHSLKENFRQERLKLTEETERLQNEVELMKVTLRKEIEYKDNMEQSHHSLLVEQQELNTKLSEQEDLVQERSRELTKMKVQKECLEEENNELKLRIDTMGKQKANLERLIKQQQLDKDKSDLMRMIASQSVPGQSGTRHIIAVHDGDSFVNSSVTGSPNSRP